MSFTPRGNDALHDDELASARSQVLDHGAERSESETARLRQALASRDHLFGLVQRGLDGVRIAIWIVASWVPLNAIQPIASSFAGTDTRFEASLTVSIALTVFMSIALSITFAQSRLRKQKVQRQRQRLDDLEAQVLRARRRIGELEQALRAEGNLG